MKKIKVHRWHFYVMAFLLIWSGQVALDLGGITPTPIVRHIIIHRGVEAAIIAIVLYVVSFSFIGGTE